MRKAKPNDTEADTEAAEVAAIEAVADNFQPVINVVRGDCRDAMLGVIRATVDWGKFGEQRQRDINAAVDNAAEAVVRKVVQAIAAEGRQTVPAKLDKLTVDGGIKLNLSAMFSHDNLVLLGDLQGKQVLVAMADASPFSGERAAAPVEPDQAQLPVDQGDNSDLADAGDELVRTGDELAEGQARVNIGTGMIEALPQGADGSQDASWVDVREATPAEMAAERERGETFEEADAEHAAGQPDGERELEPAE